MRWVFFAIGCLVGVGLTFVLHIHEKRGLVSERAVAKWESNWLGLKQGMTKEQVLALVGAPSSTTVEESHITSSSSNPPNPKLEQHVQQTLDGIMNYAIWSYYGSQVIHTTPGEDVRTAMSQTANQVIPLLNISGGGKLQGHAIKFNGAGQIVDISSQ